MERFPVIMTTLFDAARAFPSVFDAPAEPAASTMDETAEDPGDAPTFTGLGLPRALLRTLEQADITRPFPIQAATIRRGGDEEG